MTKQLVNKISTHGECGTMKCTFSLTVIDVLRNSRQLQRMKEYYLEWRLSRAANPIYLFF